ncbi:hypothetical protein QL285_007341 [Trifolium repens]|jgi:hypothetical protein|nr:hypothetical protein QL285_007338 [Trifolium repens]KAK2448039.1 hypothetical protein QL285_007341 [Trifolium repens]
MGSKSVTSIITILILSLNIIFFTTLTSAQGPNCPDLSACANVLETVGVGLPQAEPCCAVLGEVAEVEAAVCLCQLAANVLGTNGVNINTPVQALLTRCGRDTSNIPACA